MEIKIGYDGKHVTLPVSKSIDWKNIKGGIVFYPDNINEEALIDKIIDVIGKHSPNEIDKLLTTI